MRQEAAEDCTGVGLEEILDITCFQFAAPAFAGNIDVQRLYLADGRSGRTSGLCVSVLMKLV